MRSAVTAVKAVLKRITIANTNITRSLSSDYTAKEAAKATVNQSHRQEGEFRYMNSKQDRNLSRLKEVLQAEADLTSLKAMKLSDEKRAEQFMNNFPFRCCAEEYKKCAELSEEMMKRSAQSYNDCCRHYIDVRRDAERAIDSLPDSRLRQIMRWRYLENKTMEEIAEKLYYSLRTVKYKHSQALELMDFGDATEKNAKL